MPPCRIETTIAREDAATTRNAMPEQNPPHRCRLVLIAPAEDSQALAGRLSAALDGGDVASLILPQHDLGEDAFQRHAEQIVPLAQERGVAVVIAGDTRIAARVKADGIHVEGDKATLADAIDRFQPRFMVGAGRAKTRDEALELGETRPDYMFFGRIGHDSKPEPHHRNLSLGRWWAEMIEIPCIVLGGSDLASVEAVAAAGAEFVALSSAIFAGGRDPGAAVAEANRILDEMAPRFEAAE
jgi:thiamine-phosphate pyrophosphorylase